MAPAPDELRAELLELENRKRKQQEAIEHIRDILAKADQRRIEDDDSGRDWNRVIDHLEMSLDEAKSRLAACKREIRYLQRRIDRIPSDSTAAATEWAPERMASADGPVTDPKSAAARILDTPIESVSELPLEVIALGVEYANRQEGSADIGKSDLQRLSSRLELYRHLPEPKTKAPTPSTNLSDRRHQLLLRRVTQKIIAHAVEDMSLQEIELAVHTYQVLCDRTHETEEDRRLHGILQTRIEELQQRLLKITAALHHESE